MTNSTRRIGLDLARLAVLQVLLSVCPSDAQGQHRDAIAFLNSGAEAAQADFLDGVVLLHNFEYEEAGEAFQRAQDIDPDFAMAYWGEAMALHRSLWQQQSRSATTAHAQHMTSHIFTALGMWDDVVAANETAIGIEVAGPGARTREALHYVHWLQNGYLQQGRFTEATKLMQAARARLQDEPTARERAFYGAMYGRWLFDIDSWDSTQAWVAPDGVEIPTPQYHFARAFIALWNGDRDAAREHRRSVRVASEGNPGINYDDAAVHVLQTQLDALFACAEGDHTNAVALARDAVSLERALPFHNGPPYIVKPATEMLGDLLLELDRAEEAVTAYHDQLSWTPNRTVTLRGLARAAHNNPRHFCK